jgi:acyl-CoA synthetase (AMP-forming)/AMP-acid ligase II
MQSDESNVSDFLLARGDDSDVAIIDGNRRYTYGELRTAASKIAGSLAHVGLPPGARVGLLGANSFFWIAAYLAAMKVGVAVPMSDRSTVEDIAAQAGWVDLAAVLMDRRMVRRFGPAFADRPTVTDACLQEGHDPAWPSSVTAQDSDAALMFTSGTTSRPRAVRVTHANLLANTRSIVSYLELDRHDRILVVLPFHYCYGASLLHTHLAVGASVALCHTFTFPETAIDQIERQECTGFAGVPSSFQLLLRTSSYLSRSLPSLRKVQQAGGRLPPQLIRELAAAHPGAKLYVMYGQTEATARLSYLPPDLLEQKLGSVGRGIPDVELAVLDESGEPVQPGAVGEIVARGPSISPGYVNDAEETARKFPDGMLRTGDLATVDSDGFIFIVGRSGDFIKSWGHRISSQQIEETALQHPSVGDAVAVGLPDPDAGEAVTLAVMPAPHAQIDSSELAGFLRAHLAKHMVPRSIHVLDALPLTASGKVSKAELRELLASRPAQVP